MRLTYRLHKPFLDLLHWIGLLATFAMAPHYEAASDVQWALINSFAADHESIPKPYFAAPVILASALHRYHLVSKRPIKLIQTIQTALQITSIRVRVLCHSHSLLSTPWSQQHCVYSASMTGRLVHLSKMPQKVSPKCLSTLIKCSSSSVLVT